MAFDYSGMKELFNQVQSLQKHHDAFIRNFLKEMGLRCLAETKRRTPVLSGHLRRNWQLSDVYRRGNELYIVLWNPVEYSSFVEQGHRLKTKDGDEDGWWEGYHMAKVSIDKINEEIPARYDRAMQQFIAGLGGG